MHIGKQIKKIATESGKKQKDIAEALGVSIQHLYNLFGKESIETKYLFQFTEIFQVPITSFFDIEVEKWNKPVLLAEVERLKKEIEEIKNINRLNENLVGSATREASANLNIITMIFLDLYDLYTQTCIDYEHDPKFKNSKLIFTIENLEKILKKIRPLIPGEIGLRIDKIEEIEDKT